MRKYTVGIDFGTLSGRALLVDVATGEEVATSVMDYPYGVMDSALPDGTPLGVDWALQHPQDYLDVVKNVVPAVMEQSGAKPEQVIGVAIDFTSCTIMPVKADGTPLCFLPEFRGNPNAYAKLWKHHAAQDKANELNRIAIARGEPWLKRCGGKVSSEWFFPKIWQILDEAPEIYAQCDHITEAGDWLIWMLGGTLCRNAFMSGFKCMWSRDAGYPSHDFLKALDPRLEFAVEEKLRGEVKYVGDRAGSLTGYGAGLTGLKEGTAVAVCAVDAFAMPAAKVTGPGVMMATIGTSTCHTIMTEQERDVAGICGVVEGGLLPGFFGYEAGQACVGDHFAWLIKNMMPAEYHDEAKRRGMGIHALLREKAERLRPGESGLIALDWWNGSRTPLVDGDLTGMMLGMTLQTRAEEMYRALIEATAYGTRKIIENFRAYGVPVDGFVAAGGIALKDPMLLQIYADVIRMPIRIAGSAQSVALTAAITGAVAAGSAQGGYDSIYEAAEAMGRLKETVYRPDSASAEIYDSLYGEYETLLKYFGTGENDVMKRLKGIKKRVLGE